MNITNITLVDKQRALYAKGAKLVPCSRKSPYPFINIDTLEYGYPLSHNGFKNVEKFAIVLLDHILIDVDAYKEVEYHSRVTFDGCRVTFQGCRITEKLFKTLKIDHKLINKSLFQERKSDGLSNHYLFKLPDEIKFTDLCRQSNDGKLIPHVDFKTGRQLCYIKEEKILHSDAFECAPVLPLDAVRLVFGLKTEKNNRANRIAERKTTEITTAYGKGCLRNIHNRATAFTQEGNRNSSLASAVVAIYELVAGGEIADIDAQGTINSIVKELEIEQETDTQSTIDYNKAKGLRQPRSRYSQSAVQHSDRTLQLTAVVIDRIKDSINAEYDYDLTLDSDVISRTIGGTWWNRAQKEFLCASDINITHLQEPDYISQHKYNFGTIYDNTKFIEHLKNVVDYRDKPLTNVKITQALNKPLVLLVGFLKQYNQSRQLNYSVDMFANKPSLSITDDTASFSLVSKKLLFSGPGRYSQQHIDTYKQLFPNIDDVLEFLVAARFAPDRKNCYLWIQAPSNWGKSFFKRCLQHLCVEMSIDEIEKTYNGVAVGKTAHNFVQSFALVVEEFKTMRSEVKQLENDIRISAKFQLETTVPLYAKLFFSAESVDSLIGVHGVEEQFSNRFCYMKFNKNFSSLNIEACDLREFNESVQNYYTETLKRLIERYISSGKEDAEKQAIIYLDSFNNNYNILRSTESLQEGLEDIATDIIDIVNKLYTERSQLISVIEYKNYLYLKKPVAGIKNIFNDRRYFDRSEARSLSYKTREIIRKLGGNNTYYTGHGSSTAVRIPLITQNGDDFEEI